MKVSWFRCFAVFLMLSACHTVGGGTSNVKDNQQYSLPNMFDEKVDVFGPEKCPPPGCWTNYMRVTDIDHDGDLDVVAVNYKDFFSGSDNGQPLAIYLNDGQANFSDGSAMINNFTAALRQVAIADISGDGFPDIYAPNAAGKPDAFFISDGHGGFSDEAGTRVGGRTSHAGAVRFLDVDNDGDLDLFVAEGYAKGPIGSKIGVILLNDGHGVFKESAGAITGSIKGNDINDVDVFDADNDFDPDILINPHNGGNVALLENDGNGHFTVKDSAIGPAPGGGNHYDPVACDFNDDGFLDVFVDNIGGGYNELLLTNDKTGAFVDTTTHVVGNDNGEDDNGLVCADVDNDGHYDAVILSLYAAGERLLLNDGHGTLTYRAAAFKQFQDGTLWGEFGDLNGDKKIDLVTAQGESGATLQNRVFLANDLVPVDDRPPYIRTTESLPASGIAQGAVLRFSVSDRSITDEGPRLKSAFARWTSGGVTSVWQATFVGGDLFRVAIPATQGAGTIELCATDLFDNTGCGISQVVH